MLKPFKYLIRPIAVEVGQDGRVVGEVEGSVAALYTPEQVAEFIATIEEHLGEPVEE